MHVYFAYVPYRFNALNDVEMPGLDCSRIIAVLWCMMIDLLHAMVMLAAGMLLLFYRLMC